MFYDDPKIWGRPAWTFLFSCLLDDNINDDNRENCRKVLEELGNVLPCKVCREHYNEHIKKIPIDVEDPLEWLVKLYKIVNNKQNMKDEDIIKWFSIIYEGQRPPVPREPHRIIRMRVRKIN